MEFSKFDLLSRLVNNEKTKNSEAISNTISNTISINSNNIINTITTNNTSNSTIKLLEDTPVQNRKTKNNKELKVKIEKCLTCKRCNNFTVFEDSMGKYYCENCCVYDEDNSYYNDENYEFNGEGKNNKTSLKVKKEILMNSICNKQSIEKFDKTCVSEGIDLYLKIQVKKVSRKGNRNGILSYCIYKSHVDKKFTSISLKDCVELIGGVCDTSFGKDTYIKYYNHIDSHVEETLGTITKYIIGLQIDNTLINANVEIDIDELIRRIYCITQVMQICNICYSVKKENKCIAAIMFILTYNSIPFDENNILKVNDQIKMQTCERCLKVLNNEKSKKYFIDILDFTVPIERIEESIEEFNIEI